MRHAAPMVPISSCTVASDAWTGEGMDCESLVSYRDVKGKITVWINANFLAPIMGKSIRVGNGDDDSEPGIE